jgi:hypothetical protein
MLRTKTRIALLMLLPLAVGCGRRRYGSPAATNAPPMAATIPAARPAAVQAPREKRLEAAAASFTKDHLDECVDVSFDITAPKGSGPDWKPPPDLDPASMFEDKDKEPTGSSAKLTKLAQRCDVQFADREPLARCEMPDRTETDKSGATVKVRLSASYYSFATVGVDDGIMRECLEREGKWSGVARNSDAWELARLEHQNGTARAQARPASQ